ncbi:LysR family transcriptional regulator [Noviherbaspirillum pedocola]|uniref:LysR family transcriptional regulator n=1 Tax=Noviherbaspirillum pedocola TaxID=2801341 RepID=A0A934W9Q3_9BURK|nr:LysR family transcriptional regulator [Noviherbaspirillum pedocola]MBK4738478.1 LysR family transcriptional regulator [Noviherbaspirillum pedocola]
MDRWSQFELFVQVAELSSLSKAAEALDISNAAASRALASLEERLNARLVERNTRRVSLSEAGQDFYRHCKAVLNQMKEAEAAINAVTLAPTGTLRVTSSLSFCMRHIAPLLPEFNRRYPDLTLEIVAANRYFDLLDSGIDLAIRTREYESDSDITVRKLASTRRILAASPAYFATHGRPETLEDLVQHKLLIYSYANNPYELRFTKDGDTQVVVVKSVMQSNDGQIIRAAALEGLGILVQPNYIIYDDIVAGRLVPVLNDWDLPRLTINLAYQSRKHLPAKVRVFIDFLVQHFNEMDFERRWTK